MLFTQNFSYSCCLGIYLLIDFWILSRCPDFVTPSLSQSWCSRAARRYPLMLFCKNAALYSGINNESSQSQTSATDQSSTLLARNSFCTDPDKLDDADGASKMPLADLRTAWWTTWVAILSFLSCSVRLGTARDLGLETLVKPNLRNVPGSECKESVSDSEWSESEKPGGGLDRPWEQGLGLRGEGEEHLHKIVRRSGPWHDAELMPSSLQCSSSRWIHESKTWSWGSLWSESCSNRLRNLCPDRRIDS